MSAAELRVRVTPRAAACKVVARALGIAPSRVTVARGAGSRQKSLRVEGLDQKRLKAALRPWVGPPETIN